jgi:abequosyltransferase
MTFKLSICIPTYNRARFIAATLESIVSQLRSDVEIVIMDGASTDNTEAVVEKFQRQYENIRYFRGETNSGVDADLATSINLAQGEFCWLMSSDDLLTSEAIHRVLTEIESGSDIYLCNRTECSKEMVPIQKQYWFPKTIEDRIFELKDGNALREYLDATSTLGGLFSYIPCVIVRKNDWLSIQGADEFFNTGYSHVFRLFSIIKKGCRLTYIRAALVLCRMDNDSFSSKGLVNRYLLDFNGYKRIADSLFSDDITHTAFLSVLIREHKWYRILKLRAHVKNNREWQSLKSILLEIGYSPFTLALCGWLGDFKKLVSLMVLVKKNRM